MWNYGSGPAVTDGADMGVSAQFRLLRTGSIYEIMTAPDDREMINRKDE